MTKRTLLDDMTDAERKAVPLALIFDYFPDAMIELAQVIQDGQRQHGTTGWDRAKSPEHRNTLLRHFLQGGTTDKDGRRHSAKVFWRAAAALQIEIEAERANAVKTARRCPAGKGCRTCKAQARRKAKRPS